MPGDICVRTTVAATRASVLISLVGGLSLALAVWLVIPSVSHQRLMSVHGRDPLSKDVLLTWFDRRRRSEAAPTEKLSAALRSLTSELRAGVAPGEALARAAGTPPLWPNALTAARLGEAVDSGFLADAERNAELATSLRQLAACWHVGVTRGSGLAVSVERLALSLRTQQELHTTLRNELAAPRATSRMLAFLPVVGVGMGYLLGADPIAWFFSSSIGAMVFAIALVLTLAGSAWTRAIVRRVERGLV